MWCDVTGMVWYVVTGMVCCEVIHTRNVRMTRQREMKGVHHTIELKERSWYGAGMILYTVSCHQVSYRALPYREGIEKKLSSEIEMGSSECHAWCGGRLEAASRQSRARARDNSSTTFCTITSQSQSHTLNTITLLCNTLNAHFDNPSFHTLSLTFYSFLLSLLFHHLHDQWYTSHHFPTTKYSFHK